MSLFDNMLKDSESLFLDSIALDYDYQPKLVPYRESHQKFIASCIAPLFQDRNGKNLFIFGPPGIGKTVSTKHVLNELQEKTDDIIPLYINCWKKDTPHKIVLEICERLNYKFVHNKNTSELLKEISRILSKESAVLVLDEADKLLDKSIIYTLAEGKYNKSIILITNDKDYLASLDQRVSSRLVPSALEFQPYTKEQTFGILKQRMEYAFVPNVFKKEAFEMVAQRTYNLKDIRTGLFLLKESAEIAESQSSKIITEQHAIQALENIKGIKIKNSAELEDESRELYHLIQKNSGKTAKDLYELYKIGRNKSYRTLLRKIKILKEKNWISIKEITTGPAPQFIINPIKDIL